MKSKKKTSELKKFLVQKVKELRQKNKSLEQWRLRDVITIIKLEIDLAGMREKVEELTKKNEQQ
jgi:hypothetical protein